MTLATQDEVQGSSGNSTTPNPSCMHNLIHALQQVMGGKDSASFSYFRELCVQGLLEARKPQNSQVSLFVVRLQIARPHLPCACFAPFTQVPCFLVVTAHDRMPLYEPGYVL
jgi:hypothetical protein